MTSEPFLKPRLIGARFDGGVIPLEVLADFAALEEMVVEVAKWRYRQANPGRQRVPRGFTEGVSLKLAAVEDGSAVPVIGLFVAAATLFPPASQSYFEDARESIVEAIGAAERGASPTDFLPPNLLGYFDRFGRSLGEGESIEFSRPPGQEPATLTKSVRRTLVLASSAEAVTDEVVIHGLIPEVDQQAMSFQIRLADGTKAKAPLPSQHQDTVLEAVVKYKAGQFVRLYGTGRFTRSGRLQSVDSVEHISLLDPLDIGVRIDELGRLKDGWLDGKGISPDRAGLDRLAEAFGYFYPDDLPLPHLYPTAEGRVRAEWSIGAWESSLEIDLATRAAEWHALNLDDDREDAREIRLDSEAGWRELAEALRGCGGAAA